MKEYFYDEASAEAHCAEVTDNYPSHQEILKDYVVLPEKVPILRNGTTQYPIIFPPSPLVVRALGELHSAVRPDTHVLDLGCHTGSQSLFLAANGFKVTAMDVNPTALDIASKMARALEIPEDNFKAIEGDAQTLADKKEYDIIIAANLLHFFNKEQYERIVRRIQVQTARGGLNLLSAYTKDNPSAEKDLGRQYLFDDGELLSQYNNSTWRTVHSITRLGHKPMDRKPNKFIVPTITELIVQRRTSAQGVGRTALQAYPENLARSDPELYDYLSQNS